ncbi:MAG: 30S ribosomal protein S10 [Candidatus Peregrinibacteria bacterium]
MAPQKKAPAKKSPPAKDTKKKAPVQKKTRASQPSLKLRPASKREPVVAVQEKKHTHSPTPKKAADAKAVPSIRIRLSAFDHTVLDEAAAKIIDTAERSGAVIHGPIPLPTRIRKFTVNRSTFVHKNSRDQFEMRTHRRLIDLKETTFKTMESLQSLSLPSGVDIEIKMR